MTREPQQTVCDGQTLLGEIFAAADGQFTARDRDGNEIGKFSTIDAARSAIISNRMAERREASRNG